MTLRTPPSWLQNGSHPAANDRLTTQALWKTSGIINAGDMAVSQNSPLGMSVLISSGWACVVGSSFSAMGSYMVYNDAPTVVTLTAAPVSNPRIDIVTIKINDAFYAGALNDVEFVAIAGTPAASPVAPATPADSLLLATIAVGVGVTSIVNANITDKRVIVATIFNTLSVNAQVGTTYTPTALDPANVVSLTNALPIAVTIPTHATIPLPLNVVLTFFQGGAGQVTIAGAGGVTITSNGATSATPKTRTQESWVQGYQSATDVWHFFGDIV